MRRNLAIVKPLAYSERLREARKAVRAWDLANYKGWQRFFMVPGGHIHASTGCHSLRITTLITWLPELSGETEAEAVAEHGAMLCTKCFPSAPVEWTIGNADPSKCSGAPIGRPARALRGLPRVRVCRRTDHARQPAQAQAPGARRRIARTAPTSCARSNQRITGDDRRQGR